MDRVVAFGKAITTWGQWVDKNIIQNKTKVFFQGISPSHYKYVFFFFFFIKFHGTIRNASSTTHEG